jgi:non-specific serine/threonine protein kinase/serine/threonine-protein kinase
MKDDAESPTLPTDSEATRSVGSAGEPGLRTIDNYRLLQKVGEGGMGEVFVAEQLRPIRRKVAFKVIKRGMDTAQVVARFETERQALAMMEHPCIAKVFDAGSTPRGRPYFVMEYVPGVPITQHCDRNRLATRERLELFIQVCEGVQHAHQKAIIHRDLKPSNVLVAIQDGNAMPKIIDFGVAKATAQSLTEKTMYTQLGQLIGTPEYMSPEQAEMTGQDIDTRSDVYSLGVLLYVLLVGALPFDAKELRRAGFDEIRRRIREIDPPRPSTRISTMGDASSLSAQNRGADLSALRSQLRGDLDWITMKALEKDRTRRYGSPSELAADIRRHLEDEPVLACPPSATYKMQKFVRRHRFGVAAATAVFLLLVSFAVTMAVQANRIAKERDRANQEAETASQVSGFLEGLFEVSDPSEALGNTITAREILDKGSGRIRQELGDQPRVQARLMDTMGRVYRNLGLYDQARPLLEEAVEIQRGELGPEHPELAGSLKDLGNLLKSSGDYEAAKPVFERALTIRQAALGPEHPEVAAVLNDLATLHLLLRDYETARPLFERALEIREKALGPEDPLVAMTLTNLAILYRRSGDNRQAQRLYERALGIQEESLGPEHPDVANTLNNLATLHMRSKEYETARPLFERSLAIREKVLGPDHPDVAVTLNNLGILMESMGKHREAQGLHERALVIREQALGPEHPDVAYTLSNLAYLARVAGDFNEAESLYRRALAIRENALGRRHPRVAVVYYNLAALAALQDNRQGALGLLLEALDRGLETDGLAEDPDFVSLRGDAEFEEIVSAFEARAAGT